MAAELEEHAQLDRGEAGENPSQGSPAEHEEPGAGGAPERQPGTGSAGGEAAREPRGSGLSSYCYGAPMWSMHHLSCQRSDLAGRCSCPCHAEGWERPGYPPGARLSKFNPDNTEERL